MIEARSNRHFFYPWWGEGPKAWRASRRFAQGDLPSYLLGSNAMPRRHILLSGQEPQAEHPIKEISLRRHGSNKKEVFDMTENLKADGGRRGLPPDEYMRYVEAAKREARCRACGGPIEPGRLHFCFRYRDGAWRRKFRLCGSCIRRILQEVKT